MNQSYESHVRERAAQGIPPLPLTAEQTGEVCRSLVNPEIGQDATLADLLAERVPPGVDPAAKIKAEFLAAIARGDQESHFLLPEKAVELLGAMLGGYNIPRLIELLDDVRLAPLAAKALKHTVFIFDNFKTVDELRQRGNKFAFAMFSDTTGQFEAVIFSDTLAAARDLLEPGTPVKLTV